MVKCMTDLINGRMPEEIKDALKHCIEPVPYGCEVCPYNETCLEHEPEIDAIALIERLESERDEALAKVPKWISVEERLPEKLNENNQMYITEEVIGFNGECAYIGQYKVYKYDGYCTFFDGNYFRDDVTHWMPLPEPPEDGE